MKRILFFVVCTAQILFAQAQGIKQIFLPDSIRCYDLNDDNSRWSWHRTLQTQNLIIFWEKGFGYDLSNPPQLDGHPMSVNSQALYERLEKFYTYFHDTLKFTQPGSKADKYKMMVMLNYSLDGTAYGGTYDDFIGALWVAPNRIQDKKMNCMAHELGHCFQLQIPADSVGAAWGGSGFYEMTSQWMLWRVNPDWLTDENYHFEAFKTLTHKAYLDLANIYHSPYVIEYWAEKRGQTSIADLYRKGRVGEDPVMTYKEKYGLTQQQFNDEMIDCYQHLMNFDFHHAYKETRRYACTFSTPMVSTKTKAIQNTVSTADGWLTPDTTFIPEAYGFNAIKIDRFKPGKKVTAEVKGKELRYAFVYIDENGTSHYGKPVSSGKATIQLPSSSSSSQTCLYLVVMGAPQKHEMLNYEGKNPQYPYSVRISQ